MPVFTKENKFDLIVMFGFVLIVLIAGGVGQVYIRQGYVLQSVAHTEEKYTAVERRLDTIETLLKVFLFGGDKVRFDTFEHKEPTGKE